MNHASLIDGMRLSGARIDIFPHNDLAALERLLDDADGANGAGAPRRTFVVTESYFSMDADGPDLVALRALCDRKGALLVLDETHALGVFGPEGRGLAAAANVVPDVFMGALGKAFGLQGGFAAGAPELRSWLWNAARSFVFSTGMAPLLAKVGGERLRRVQEGNELRASLAARAKELRDALGRLGLAPLGHGPIVPWVIGDAERTVALAAALREGGFHVQGIRPPTVPVGTSRLRLTVTARHTEQDVRELVDALRRTLP
jgi:8-amino-7-oxononanoate synthase